MAESEPDPIRALFVEGQEDEHVIGHIAKRARIEATFSIVPKGGDVALIKSIIPEIIHPGRVAVGFVIDADENPDSQWRKISDRLRRRSIQAPPKPEFEGTVIDGRPRVGIWLMPDNKDTGELENFVTKMVPDDNPVWPLAEDYIEAVPRSCLHTKPVKAKVHAWLATHERPFRMGEAIRNQAFDIDGPLCQSFIAWLRRLFG